MILDLSILFIGLFIFLFLKAIDNNSIQSNKLIVGSKIIVKGKRDVIIHAGLIDHLDGDCAICYNNYGGMFVAWASHLFWSESDQAFIERI